MNNKYQHLKRYIKLNFPRITFIVNAIRHKYWSMKSIESIFTEFYIKNRWGGSESVSGPGSDLLQTIIIRKEIPKLIRELGAKTLLDAPCGDLNWISKTDLGLEKYIGVDVISELIKQNNIKFATKYNIFMKLDITKDNLPEVDIILCRDCFIHFSFKDIFSTIKNFKRSNSKYLLTTNFTQVSFNQDIITGDLRPINLQLPPFRFSQPLSIINEKCTIGNGKYADKILGLWAFKDIDI